MDESVSAAEACRDSLINAYWNNVSAIPNQSVIDGSQLSSLLAYVIVGGMASVFNIFCILIFVTDKDLRQKYMEFAFLAFANLFNTVFMFETGIRRRNFIFTNQYNQLRSSFECLQYLGPHLQILGNQLPALVLLVIDIERLIAVHRPMFYKIYITNRNRVLIVIGCFMAALISLVVGNINSYMNRKTCVTSSCSMGNAYGLSYSNFNSIIVILFPISAFILNIFTYQGAKRLGEHADMKKELRLVLITLIITSVDVLMIAGPNIILLLSYNNVIKTWSWFPYLFVCFCCNSATNLIVYICFKRDFRNHLVISINRIRKFSKMAVEMLTRGRRKVAPSNMSSVPIRRSVLTMPTVRN